jgi:hypothetical protein
MNPNRHRAGQAENQQNGRGDFTSDHPDHAREQGKQQGNKTYYL